MQRFFPRKGLAILFCLSIALCASSQTAHTLTYASGKHITLRLPSSLDISVAATGLKRVRFFAKSPDGRIFVTGMHDLSDNRRGSVFILDGWDEQARRYTRVIHYLDHLRNPNNIAFWTDLSSNQTWLYLPLTDKLVRYKYSAGDIAPTSAPETLIQFPNYGLQYKYGGWHLTRTVAIAEVKGKHRIFVAAGSSCNYCQETEVLRAAVVSMDPDGKHPRMEAQGLRNAVDLHPVPEIADGALFATNMGDDHLGDKLPEDTFFELAVNTKPVPNYGWPTCYFSDGKAVLDTTPLPSLTDAKATGQTADQPEGDDSVYGEQAGVAAAGTNLAAGGGRASDAHADRHLGRAPEALKSCENVPPAYTTFAAHSSPLGFAYFGNDDSILGGNFLVSLHGASHPRIGTGYKVVQFTPADRKPRDFITGFLTTKNGKPTVHGRPCGIFRLGHDTFLLSDDYLGVIYYVHPSKKLKTDS